MSKKHRRYRQFGFRSLFLLVIAGMVGTGAFTTSGFTLAVVGSPGRVLACWLAGGAIALCGAIAYGRLATFIPESGGEYLYLTRFVNPYVGFLAGWISLTAGFSGAIAVAALAFEAYAIPSRPEWLPPDVIAVAAIILCGLVHGTHARFGIRLQNLVVVFQLLALVAFLILVQLHIHTHEWHSEPLPGFSAEGITLLSGMAISIVWISVSYAGFNSAVYIASEAFEPRRDIPSALIWGTVAVMCLYLVLNAVFVMAVPPESLVGKVEVAAIAAQAIGGWPLEMLIRAAIAVGLLTSVAGMVLTGPRVYGKMASDGVFPRWFKGRDGTGRSIMLQCLLAVGLIICYRFAAYAGAIESSLSELLLYLGTTLSLSSACCVATLLLPRARKEHATSFPMGDAAALLYVLATIAAIVLMTLTHEVNGVHRGLWHLLGTGITLVSGTVVFLLMRLIQSMRGMNSSATA